MFELFRCTTLRFTLQAGEKGLLLPPWKASTFRGGFGHSFKKLTCLYPGESCQTCPASHYCPYTFVFETAPEKESVGYLGGYDQIPRPYVLEVPTDRRTSYEPGETLEVRLRLFGDAIQYVPIFISTFREMGKAGIGKRRFPYRLIHVESEGGFGRPSRTLYLDGKGMVGEQPIVVEGQEIFDWGWSGDQQAEGNVIVFFETPLRLKWQGRYVADPHFHFLIRSLLRRMTGILKYHHHEEIDGDKVREIIRKAESVRRVAQEVRWVDHDRYSARQDAKMKMGGIVGWAQYKGELAEFLPLLKLAELIHLGKNPVFDLGRIRLG
jgi:hypothetical protein